MTALIDTPAAIIRDLAQLPEDPTAAHVEVWHLRQRAADVLHLIQTIERSQVETPTSFLQYADRLEQIGRRTPRDQKGTTELADLLRRIRPGVGIRCYETPDAESPIIDGLVTRVILPYRSSDDMVSSPSSYSIELIEPGMERPERVALATLMGAGRLSIKPGLSEGTRYWLDREPAELHPEPEEPEDLPAPAP